MLSYSELLGNREVLRKKIAKMKQAYAKLPASATCQRRTIMQDLLYHRNEAVALQREIIARILLP